MPPRIIGSATLTARWATFGSTPACWAICWSVPPVSCCWTTSKIPLTRVSVDWKLDDRAIDIPIAQAAAMSSLITLAQSLGLAYLSGISLYASVAVVGFAQRYHWIGTMPGLLGDLTNPLVLGVATVLAVIEFLATLIPGVATLWESAHTFIRPPAAAVLAVATAWHGDPSLVLAAGLLGGGLGLATHVTRLGLRVAVDASPEPVTNGLLNIAELSVLATVSYLVWHHPIIALVVALILLVLTAMLVRMVWRELRNLFRGNWRALF